MSCEALIQEFSRLALYEGGTLMAIAME